MPINPDRRQRFQDVFTGAILPAAAIAESIITRGRSPGIAALGVAKGIEEREREQLRRQQEEQERQRQAEQAAFQRQLQGFQISEIKARRSKEEERAASTALLRRQLELAGEDPEKMSEAILQHQLRTDPDKALAFMEGRRREGIGREKIAADIARQEKKESRELLEFRRDFKKTFINDSRVKSFNEVDASFERMNAVWNQRPGKDDPTGNKRRAAIDQALITLYNKMLDPDSVVRESEYARTPQNVPVINRIKGRLQQVVEGGAGLTDQDRDEIFTVAQRLFGSAEDRYKDILNTYVSDAQESGFDLSKIFTSRDLGLMGLIQPPQIQPPQIQPPQIQPPQIQPPQKEGVTPLQTRILRSAEPMQSLVPGLSHSEVAEMKKFVEDNPQDPRAQKIREKLLKIGVQ